MSFSSWCLLNLSCFFLFFNLFFLLINIIDFTLFPEFATYATSKTYQINAKKCHNSCRTLNPFTPEFFWHVVYFCVILNCSISIVSQETYTSVLFSISIYIICCIWLGIHIWTFSFLLKISISWTNLKIIYQITENSISFVLSGWLKSPGFISQI